MCVCVCENSGASAVCDKLCVRGICHDDVLFIRYIDTYVSVGNGSSSYDIVVITVKTMSLF